MSKLLMCGVSGYLFFSGLVWGPFCGGVVVLVTFWDYFSELAGDTAGDLAAARTRKRLRSDLHAPAHPYWVLRAFGSGGVRLKARDLASDQPGALSVFALGPRCGTSLLEARSGLSLEKARQQPVRG
jgi:hypothetical protein